EFFSRRCFALLETEGPPLAGTKSPVRRNIHDDGIARVLSEARRAHRTTSDHVRLPVEALPFGRNCVALFFCKRCIDFFSARQFDSEVAKRGANGCLVIFAKLFVLNQKRLATITRKKIVWRSRKKLSNS